MPLNIVAAVDLGPSSANVVERALGLTQLHGGRLTILHCAGTKSSAAATAALQALIRSSGDGTTVQTDFISLTSGGMSASEQITAEAKRRAADLVVMGASRRPLLSQLLQGSTTVDVIRRSAIPVIIARTPGTRGYASSIVAVDTDKPFLPMLRQARRVLGPIRTEVFTVLDEATRLQMTVVSADREAIEAYDRERLNTAYRTLTSAAGQVAEPGWAPLTRAIAGRPEHEIVRRIEAAEADIIVMQPEQKGWLVRTLLGSLTEQVMAATDDCDMLIIPTTS